jgi:hypothetical protein
MEEILMMWPEPCSRRTGGAARVTSTTPKRLVSIWSRKACSGMSSMAAMSA